MNALCPASSTRVAVPRFICPTGPPKQPQQRPLPSHPQACSTPTSSWSSLPRSARGRPPPSAGSPPSSPPCLSSCAGGPLGVRVRRLVSMPCYCCCCWWWLLLPPHQALHLTLTISLAFLASTRHTNPQCHVLAGNHLVLAQSVGSCFRALPPPPAVVHHRAAGGAGISRLCHQLCHFYHQAVEGACGAAAAAAAAQGGVNDAGAASGPVDAFCRCLMHRHFVQHAVLIFLHLSYLLTHPMESQCAVSSRHQVDACGREGGGV